jgi:hypothetical protein
MSVLLLLASMLCRGSPRSSSRVELTVHFWLLVEVLAVTLVLPPASLHGGVKSVWVFCPVAS